MLLNSKLHSVLQSRWETFSRAGTSLFSSGVRGWSKGPRLRSMDFIFLEKWKRKLSAKWNPWEWFKEWIETSENNSLFFASMDLKLGPLLHPLTPELRREVRALEKVAQRLCKTECSLLFNSVSVNESLLPNYSNSVLIWGQSFEAEMEWHKDFFGLFDHIFSRSRRWVNIVIGSTSFLLVRTFLQHLVWQSKL